MDINIKKVLNYLHFCKYIFLKGQYHPIYVVLFVTEQCICKCKHCFVKGEIRKEEELTLTEIEKISKNMGKILFLLVTGGEPFFRDDISNIIDIFVRNNSVLNIGIPTNGFMTEKIVIETEKILCSHPEIDFAIDISVDGIGDEHDKIRGVNGLFIKAIETYKQLKVLTNRYPNFNLNIAVTVSYFNQDRLSELYNFLTKDLGVININHLLIRGEPRDTKALDIDINKYTQFCLLLKNGLIKQQLSGYSGYPFSSLINSLKIIRQEVIQKIITQKKRIVPCLAGQICSVIRSNGDVYPCEILNKKMGSLRVESYDFSRILLSKDAQDVRKWIKGKKCYCTYECFLTCSLFFNPLFYILIILTNIKLKILNLLKKGR